MSIPSGLMFINNAKYFQSNFKRLHNLNSLHCLKSLKSSDIWGIFLVVNSYKISYILSVYNGRYETFHYKKQELMHSKERLGQK